MEIPNIPLENLVNKVIKIISREKPSLIDIDLKNNLQPGKLLQVEIVNLLPKKKVAISFAGKNFVLELPETSLKQDGNSFTGEAKNLFKPGNKIYAKIERLNPSPVLKLISPRTQQSHEEGYITEFSRKIRPEIIKFEESRDSKLRPDEIVSVKTKLKDNKNVLPNDTKAELSFKTSNKIYSKIEKLDPLPVLNLTQSLEEKMQEDRFIRNFSRSITPDILDFTRLKGLKLPNNNIVLGKIVRTNNRNTVSVQLAGQKFIVKSEYANLYNSGEKVRIQFKKVVDGFRPVLLDPPSNRAQNSKDTNILTLDYSAKFKNLALRTQTESKKIDNENRSTLKDSPVNFKIIDLDFINPYLPIKKPLGKLIGYLKRELLGSSVLKKISIKPELIERIRETLQILTPKPNTLPKASYIKRQVEISGIGYEAKVKQLLLYPEDPRTKIELTKDLKGQLLELSLISETAISKISNQSLIRQLTDFQQKIKVAVDNIELNQVSTKISNQENQPLVLQIPNPISPNEKTINLFIRKDSDENKNGENSDKGFYNLAFYLELSSLGNIKMNVKVGADSMIIRMSVDREDVAEFVHNNVPEFEQRMKINDLNTTVECFIEEKILPIKDNLIELLVSKNTSLLNVKT